MNFNEITIKIKNMFSNIVAKYKKINKKIATLILVTILIIIIIITFIIGSINKRKLKNCENLYNSIGVLVEDYLTEKNLYPVLLGDSVTVNLNELPKVEFKNKEVTGSVKYTKYETGYVKTYYIENCGYCSKKEFKKSTDKYDEKRNMEVYALYNYYDVAYYDTKWTNYFEPDKISTELTNGVNLPLDLKKLPEIPNGAQVVEYVKEDKLYYSYRDILYKYYKNNINYSGFSSVAPAGYTTKDPSTQIYTELTDWSLNYPGKEDYRDIEEKTGYRWYYEENKKKIYWNDGAYYPNQPDSKYNKKSKETAKMYRYKDKMWKWYNGSLSRGYSQFQRTKPTTYNYIDTDLYQYTNWTGYKDTSSLNNDTIAYREEVTKTYSRYMIKYRTLSFAKLDKAITKEELEALTGKTLETLMSDPSIYVEVKFEFKY